MKKIKIKPKYFYARIEISKEKLEKKPEKSFAEELLPIYKKEVEANILFFKKTMEEMDESWRKFPKRFKA